MAFWYKYSPSANDSASVFLNFKKNGSNIFGAGINLHVSATYQYKEVPFNIWQTPDTVIIHLQSSDWRDTLLSFVGSDLIIDEVHFKSQPLTTNIFNLTNNDAIHIFPNPSNGKFFVEVKGDVSCYEIFNILGEKIYFISNVRQNSLNEFDLSSETGGIYFIKVYMGENIILKKVVIQ